MNITTEAAFSRTGWLFSFGLLDGLQVRLRRFACENPTGSGVPVPEAKRPLLVGAGWRVQ